MTRGRTQEGPGRRRPVISKQVGRGQGSARCSELPPPRLLQGIEEFNRRQFYECHETLEELWIEETDPVRHLYQGIIKIGVGFHHALRGNYRGATIVMAGGIDLLQPFRPCCMGIDIEALQEAAKRALAELERLGPDRISEFDQALIPMIRVNRMQGGPCRG